jgi:thermostable 8-oxoguanine DNA glycosylase
MIDPTDVTKFDRTDAELQEFWLFCLCVAGKTAVTQAKHLEAFLSAGRAEFPNFQTPFQVVAVLEQCGMLLDSIKDAKLGQYNKLSRAFSQSLGTDLKTCTIADLEAIHGAGAKTARYFMLHTRANQRIACLDTHVIRHMRDLGLTTQVGTPGGKKYAELEKEFLKLADASGMSVADFDLHIWNTYAKKAKDA